MEGRMVGGEDGRVCDDAGGYGEEGEDGRDEYREGDVHVCVGLQIWSVWLLVHRAGCGSVLLGNERPICGKMWQVLIVLIRCGISLILLVVVQTQAGVSSVDVEFICL